MKSLVMHITNPKLSFDIFMVGNVQNIFMEHNLYLKVGYAFFQKRFRKLSWAGTKTNL